MPSPEKTSTGSPSSLKSTPSTVGNWSSVQTTCPSRRNIASDPQPDSNSEVRSTVAIPSSIVSPRSCVPWGTAVPTPVSASKEAGPSRSASSAAVPIRGVALWVRLATYNVSPSVNQTWYVTFDLPAGGGRVSLAEPVSPSRVEIAVSGSVSTPAGSEGTGPADSAPSPAPQLAARKPSIATRMTLRTATRYWGFKELLLR